MLDTLRENRKARLLSALLIGLVFGFLLQKGGATEYEVIVNQLLLRDFTVLKIILSAILVGMVGVYLLEHFDIADLSPKPCNIWPIVVGGLIFGAGFALLGYCPGTMAGAVGTGSIHAFMGALGMLIGTGFFALMYPTVHKRLSTLHMGEITIPDVLDISPWLVILIISVLILVSLYLIQTLGA